MQDIDIEQLPDVYRALAETIGMENMIKVAELFGGGESIYFPKLESLYRSGRDKKILEEFNGYNFKYLASKYGLTEMRIRAIVRDDIERVRNMPGPGQITFFD